MSRKTVTRWLGWIGIACLVVAAFPSVGVAQAQSSSAVAGQIQGKVVLEAGGSALSGATVTAYRIAPAPAVRVSTSTGSDGSFTVAGLAPGRYGICVKHPSGTLIDPCQWPYIQRPLSVTNGGTSGGVVIRMKKASALNVRVNDTGQFLARKSSEAFPPHVLVGAFDMRGAFHPALQTGKDSSGVSYQLSIPVDFPIRLTVGSPKVKLEDAQHAPVPLKGHSEIVVQPSSQSQQRSFTFNAVGRN